MRCCKGVGGDRWVDFVGVVDCAMADVVRFCACVVALVDRDDGVAGVVVRSGYLGVGRLTFPMFTSGTRCT